MKFFKHFTDSHRGQTMTALFKKMKHKGPCCYWILVEMCAEKLEKEEHEVYTEAHCKFRFDESVLRKNLHLSGTNLRKFLHICGDISALFSTFAGEIVEIEFPKILECLDRDSRRARTERGPSAPKRERKRKIDTADYANLNWREAANQVLEMLARYGDWSKSEAEVRAEIGDTLFEIARRAGTHKIRMLPANSFALPAVIGMLKDANNQLQLKGVSA